jgi:hypothetical protein
MNENSESNSSQINLLRYWKQGVAFGVILSVAGIFWSYQNAGPGFTEADIRFLSHDEELILNWKVLEDLEWIQKVSGDLK